MAVMGIGGIWGKLIVILLIAALLLFVVPRALALVAPKGE